MQRNSSIFRDIVTETNDYRWSKSCKNRTDNWTNRKQGARTRINRVTHTLTQANAGD